MKIRFLLLGTSLSLIPQTINAQCVATQDCSTLGYTETSCSGGSGVKCPFGNKWACFKSESEIKDQLCTELGYTQTCTGTNQTGGVGTPCNGKYAECICASDYEWKNGSCQEEVLNGPDGNVYKCNGKVVGVKTSEMDFYVAMEDLGYMKWYDARSNCQSYIFCSNVKGRSPSSEQLKTLYKNKSAINSLLSTNCGTQLTNNSYWTSMIRPDDVGNDQYIFVSMSNGNVGTTYSYGDRNYVRPVLNSY